MRKLYIAIFCLVLCGRLDAMAGDHPVQAQLRADAEVVAPGAPLRLGVYLTMEEGWHTYWQYSGDAGLPIQVDWRVPAGAEPGPLQWPLPGKYQEEGDLTVYGYADEVMLIAAATAPSSLAPGDTLQLAAEVSWLVCRELCIPGEASLQLALPVAAAMEVGADAALFDRYAARVPGPLDERVTVDLTVREAEAVEVDVRIERAGATFTQTGDIPDFYPLAADDFAFAARSPAADRIVLRLEPYGADPIERLRGVLVYAIDGVECAGVVELDLAAAPRSAGPGLLQRDYRSVNGDRDRALWVYIAFAALGGLILNLMPCVLPVISLKVLGFVGQAGAEAGRVRRLGWAFCAGIVATFLALALVVVALKSGGEQIGWGFQFQYPGFVMAMSALV
ncbi:MAG: protein-disulfide reductase DsbD family protein, partial [Candidatus Latescibacteria bacterium]|nr:protein-disulfide reductase DsbD family protein [Candidatus Latescibacterota bacterium]